MSYDANGSPVVLEYPNSVEETRHGHTYRYTPLPSHPVEEEWARAELRAAFDRYEAQKDALRP